MDKIVEVCCGNYYDALQAQYGGARRIELNSALHLGGLTPSLATLLKVKDNTDLEVICMVRPRGAGMQIFTLAMKLLNSCIIKHYFRISCIYSTSR